MLKTLTEVFVFVGFFKKLFDVVISVEKQCVWEVTSNAGANCKELFTILVYILELGPCLYSRITKRFLCLHIKSVDLL